MLISRYHQIEGPSQQPSRQADSGRVMVAIEIYWPASVVELTIVVLYGTQHSEVNLRRR